MAKKIDIAGELNAATTEGIIADSKQVRYGEEEGKTVEQKVKELDTASDDAQQEIDNLNANMGISDYPVFDEITAYTAGDVVNYNGKLYRFTADHAAGAWDETHVESASLKKDFNNNLGVLEIEQIKNCNDVESLSPKRVEDNYVISATEQLSRPDGTCQVIKYDVQSLIGSQIRIIGFFKSALETYGMYCQASDVSANTIDVSTIISASGYTFVDAIITINNNYLFVSKNKNCEVLVIKSLSPIKDKIDTLSKTLFDVSKYTSKSYDDILSAIKDVPIINRGSGLIITFKLNSGSIIRNKIYQYVRPEYATDAWENLDESWVQIITNQDLLSFTYSKEEIDSNFSIIRIVQAVTEIEHFKSLYDYNSPQSVKIEDNYVISANRQISLNDETCQVVKYDVSNLIGKTIRIRGIFNSSLENYGAYTQSETLSSLGIDTTTTKSCSGLVVLNELITVTHNYLFVSKNKEYEIILISEDKYAPKTISNALFNKTIWWCGTSIPEGRDTALGSESTGKSYPIRVSEILHATVYNESLGSSMCRRSTRTGDYVNCHQDNLLRSLSQTIEEKQYIYDNWNTIKGTLKSVTKDTLSESDKEQMFSASFENKLVPYLNGTKQMPDLFVFDHGHNDVKSYYSTQEGEIDAAIEPTTENIPNIFVEDTNMTNDSYAGLTKYFGSLDNINPSDLQKFIASVNRNSFIGAMNFLITLILRYNPRARILIITDYENLTIYKSAVDAQIKIANSWLFPCCEIYNKLGYSQHIIPGTKNYWAESGSSNDGYTGYDLSEQRIWAKDGTHPHSGGEESLQRYAELIANYIKQYFN